MTTEIIVNICLGLGALFVPIVITFAVWLYQTRRIRLEIITRPELPVYISSLCGGPNHASRVNQIAFWGEFILHNNTSSPNGLMKLAGTYGRHIDQLVPRRFFKRVNFRDIHVMGGEAIETPITVDPYSSSRFWCLIDVPIPAEVGTVILKRYMPDAHEKLVRFYNTYHPELVETSRTTLDPGKDTPDDFFELGVAVDPLIFIKDDGTPVGPIWPVLGRKLIEEVRSDCVSCGQQAVLHAKVKRRFKIRAYMASGKVIGINIKTKNNPLWMRGRLEHDCI